MKTIEQIKNELLERRIDVISIDVLHFEGLPNQIELEIEGCLTISWLVVIAGYFGGTPYVHNGDEFLRVSISDINKQSGE